MSIELANIDLKQFYEMRDTFITAGVGVLIAVGLSIGVSSVLGFSKINTDNVASDFPEKDSESN